ncbi:MAG: 3-phosphoshikimate 1-carboxyvinyltransferase [Gammaproteobacteria bacterium RIFCSPHIGHO2_12_FULL_42_13]|nr:MAG: 3-phosphoshikimate 1-carboxyvinyltransferase [Gammaproteobacteria bacterium RIFCSPHIGHO2_12_FULL_42_13]
MIITVPGDKSISHRAIIFAAISDRVVTIENLNIGEDVKCTLNAFREMGVLIETGSTETTMIIHGVGLHGLQSPKNPINCGNSGTTMRLLTGLLCAQSFNSILVGDNSLSKRPMARVAEPLRQMGAEMWLSEKNTAPIQILGNKKLRGIQYELPVMSAQVKSAILLASLYAAGETRIHETTSTRDHTERLLSTFAYGSARASKKEACIMIPGDISSAAFFIVLTAITPHAAITIRDVGVNPYRTGIIDILKLMGANITLHNQRFFNHEPVADIHVQYTPLHGITIPEKTVVAAIDEFPIVFIAAALARGKTILRHASELRVKESDRIHAMVINLKKLGVTVEEYEDGVMIEGCEAFTDASLDAYDDHRVAMALHVAATRAKGKVFVGSDANINTSYPEFLEQLRTVSDS